MKQLSGDYIFSETLRYEGHRLIYGKGETDRLEIGGFLGAAVLGALLYGEDEGHERGISLSARDSHKAFYERYEDEMLHENGGLFTAEVKALSEAYMELNGDMKILLSICGNERLYDLAFGLTMDYMEYLVNEQVEEHIYDKCPWRGPFAQWLYDAGFVETRRQQLLAIDWSDPAIVCALADEITKGQSPLTADTERPTFLFEGERAEELLEAYYNWVMTIVDKEAGLHPDANVQLAELKSEVLQNEVDWEFIKPETAKLQPAEISLFHKWMTQWVDFIQARIQPPTQPKKKKEEAQLFFPDKYLKCPTEDNPEKYAATREYVKERCKYDEIFKKFKLHHSNAEFCRQLTMLFGWYVDPNSLRKSMLRKPKRERKKYT